MRNNLEYARQNLAEICFSISKQQLDEFGSADRDMQSQSKKKAANSIRAYELRQKGAKYWQVGKLMGVSALRARQMAELGPYFQDSKKRMQELKNLANGPIL